MGYNHSITTGETVRSDLVSLKFFVQKSRFQKTQSAKDKRLSRHGDGDCRTDTVVRSQHVEAAAEEKGCAEHGRKLQQLVP